MWTKVHQFRESGVFPISAPIAISGLFTNRLARFFHQTLGIDHGSKSRHLDPDFHFRFGGQPPKPKIFQFFDLRSTSSKFDLVDQSSSEDRRWRSPSPGRAVQKHFKILRILLPVWPREGANGIYLNIDVSAVFQDIAELFAAFGRACRVP